LHNDADVAGLAEACFGAGRGCSPVFYVTVGSGIGGGLIIDGSIYRGGGSGAAEIGHLRVPSEIWLHSNPDLTPNTQNCDTVEALCSGWGIARRAQAEIARRELQAPRAPHLGESCAQDADAGQLLAAAGGRPDHVTAAVVAETARAGNRLAQQILASTCRTLGWAVASVITLINPQRVVIGGGVSMMGEDLFFGPLRREVSRHVFTPFSSSCEIVPAALGEAVVVHGALRMARQGVGSMRTGLAGP
jgi:glucokinase